MSNDLQTTEETLDIKESRRERFIRLGNKRLEKAVQMISLVENLLANRNAYDYNDKDVELIVKKLHGQIDRLKMYWHVNPMETYSQPH